MWKSFAALAVATSSLVAFVQVAEKKADAPKVPMKWDNSALVSIEVSDIAKAKAWYHDNLGCEVFFELADMGWCEVTTPAAKTVIGLSLAEPTRKMNTNGGSAICFGVSNIEESRAFLLERKVKVEEIQEIPGTVKLLTFHDPDGNTLMLYQAIMPAK